MSAPLTPVDRRAQRRHTRRRQRQRRLGWVALAFAAVVAAPVILAAGGDKHAGGSPQAPTTAVRASLEAPARVPRILRRTIMVDHATGSLPAPLQDPSSAVVGGKALLFGGLTAADASTDQIVELDSTGGRIVGHLPSARHDTAAAAIGRYAYVFGGGDGVAQLDQIVRVDPATGSATVVGSAARGELRLIGRRDRRHRLRRGRLHRDALAGHDRRLAAGRAGARRRAPAAPLRYAAVAAAGGRS